MLFGGFVGERARDTVRAMLSRNIYKLSILVGLSLATLGTVGCSKPPEVKTADHIKGGAMPEGGDWQGVYFDQVFGFLHITVSGNAAQGAWRNNAGDKWGELFGEVDGNVLKYSWTERKIGVVGPAAKSEGKGYFVYSIPTPGEPHMIKGEWGLGENEAGHTWEALKQMNMEPDPKSVRPNEMESRVGASGFDGATGDADVGNEEEGADGEKSEGGEKKEEGSPDPL